MPSTGRQRHLSPPTKLIAISAARAVLRLAQREDIFHRLSRGHIPACGAESRRARPGAAGSVDKILAASGAMGLKSAAITYASRTERSQVDFFLPRRESSAQASSKILAAYAGKAPAAAVRPRRRREISGAWAVLTGQKSWRRLAGDALATSSPRREIDQPQRSPSHDQNSSVQQKDPFEHFRKNLIGNLGDDFHQLPEIRSWKIVGRRGQRAVAVPVRRVQPEQALLAFKELAGMRVRRTVRDRARDFQGKKIYQDSPARPRRAGLGRRTRAANSIIARPAAVMSR